MLIQGNCVKEDSTNLVLTLQADPNESFLVKRILVWPDSGDTYHVLKVDRKTVGVYRVYGKTGNHLSHPTAGQHDMNLMAFCAANGIDVSIPVAEGQQFILKKGHADSHVVIVYDMHDAGDIRADMPNGSESKEFTFIQYMDASSYPDATGDCEIDLSLSPQEFPDFPCGKSVPAKQSVDILGIMGHPVGDASDGTHYIVSDYVKFVKGRETLFSEDSRGLVFHHRRPINYGPQYHADITQIGPCVGVDVDEGHIVFAEPLLFDPPLHFVSGEELLVYIGFTMAISMTLTAAAIDLALIMKVIEEG